MKRFYRSRERQWFLDIFGVRMSFPLMLLASYAIGAEKPAASTENGRLMLSYEAPGAQTNKPAAVLKQAGPLVQIRLVTRDIDTGETIPCRVVIADSLGQYWGLKGQNTTKRIFFHTPGDTLISLNPGTFRTTVFRGFEYTPVQDRVFTVPGAAAPAPFTVEIQLKRWIHMKALGWYSCDSEVHAESSLDPRGIYTVQLGEDLNILNLTALGEGSKTWDYEYWRKDPFPFSIPFYPMVIGEEWRSGTWQNHMIVMGHPRRLSTYGNGFYTYPDCPIRFSYPPALDVCDEVHSLGGIVFPCHPFQTYQPWTAPMDYPTERFAAYELPVDLALGKVDGLSVYTFNQSDTWNRYVWYKLLNCGFKIPPYAGTDVITFNSIDLPNRSLGAIPGRVRSYTYIPGQTKDLNFRDWMRESVKGRSFVSSGAMVFFTVNGELPGSELKLKAVHGGTAVAVRAEAQWMGGITSVSVIVNGKTVYTEYGGGSQKVAVNQNIRLTGSSWLAVKVDGLPVDRFNGCAHTGPVYINLDKRPIHSREDALYFVNWIDRYIALLDTANHFDTPEHKKSTFALYRKGQDVFRDMVRLSSNLAEGAVAADGSGGRTTVIRGIKMASIPAGTFQMGSDYENDPDNPFKGKVSFKGEQPVHSVTVSAFKMSATEITVGQYREFANETGYFTDAERGDGALVYLDGKWVKKPDASWRNPYQELREDLPVMCVSWNDAVKFCDWLSKKTGRKFRLPTEAEWEYACRAGSTTSYYLGAGESDLARSGWYRSNGSDAAHPAGGKTANAWGLYDMSGNLWEWCNDWLGDYSSGKQTNPSGPQSGSKRVFRGGSWFTTAGYCRSSFHYGYPPESRDTSIGFRVVSRISPQR
ncbi:MAG: SUMF1/EgtB/PvdO family nonheme iron enzyme [Candidatus Latescibacter sp.]|nr:SUMF1/EgtB/PvdO family nonheme iron enzyme [Candidatus Latescibacter sp.]